jgi:hypothetical protein
VVSQLLSTQNRSWGWRLLAAAMAAAVIAVPSPAIAANNSGINAGLRDFDAVTTANERNVWKHLALIGDRYVIYNDRGIIEGPGRIQDKWPFLPPNFFQDLDGASVDFSGPRFRWIYTFTKGPFVITFEDTGIVAGPILQVQDYDGISSYNPGNGIPVIYFAVRGSQFVTFTNLAGPAVNTPLSSIPGVTEQFTHDLDDVSVELERGSLKYSFYRDNQRLIVQNGRVLELADLAQKWPFLVNLRQP